MRKRPASGKRPRGKSPPDTTSRSGKKRPSDHKRSSEKRSSEKKSSDASSSNKSLETVYVFDAGRVCPGDILLTRVPLKLLDHSTFQSSAIQAGTRAPFSHAALCIEHGLMIEAVGAGVCRFALGATGVRSKANVKFLRLNLDVVNGPQHAQLAAHFGHQYLSRGYSLPGALGTRIAPLRKKARGDLFCSELVARAYDEARCPLLPGKKPNRIAPGDLLKSDVLRDVTKLALVPIQIDTPLMYYLDDGSHFERVAHWEVRTKLKIVQSPPVQRELAALGASVPGFFELEKVLRQASSSGLDDAIHDELVRHDFSAEYTRRTLVSVDLKEPGEILSAEFAARFEPPEDQLKNLNKDTLEFLLEERKSAIVSFQNDIASRKTDIETWDRHRSSRNSRTFDYLTTMQRPLLDVSEQLLKLFRKELDALTAEQERRRASAAQ
ncbi:hypothetical protein SAMN05192541_101610 [Bradyrhizobium arachidis]|nr:hypothetical protein SAMN05192541_101610 [Bradyrhizobium arachidis]